jgi:3-phosphoshikimate 1-carboxyvinyltransferase
MHLRIKPSKLQGILTIPPSKSHTLRAIVFALLAKGTSHIQNYLPSPDTSSMLEAARLLGAKIAMDKTTLHITGVAGKLQTPDDVIQCGNSGLVLRFIGALAGLIPNYTVLTGDASIRHQRKVAPLLSALSQLGATAESTRGDGFAPILIRGPLLKNSATLDAQDSQPVSGLIIAAAFAPHPIEIIAQNPGEKPWIDLTFSWLDQRSIPYERTGYTNYKLQGGAQIEAFSYTVPGDFSTAAFPIVAALLTGSELFVQNLDMKDAQGDKIVLQMLAEMGAQFVFGDGTLQILPGGHLTGTTLDLNCCIDALPIFAVVGCFAKGKTILTNCAIARHKESDRIASITKELRKMGASITETADGMIITPIPLQGAILETHDDHRIALSLSVAALAAKGESFLQDPRCIAKTYPDFIEQFQTIGAKIDSHPMRL